MAVWHHTLGKRQRVAAELSVNPNGHEQVEVSDEEEGLIDPDSYFHVVSNSFMNDLPVL